MKKTVGIEVVRGSLDATLQEISEGQDHLVVERAASPLVVILPQAHYAAMEQSRARLQELSDRLRRSRLEPYEIVAVLDQCARDGWGERAPRRSLRD